MLTAEPQTRPAPVQTSGSKGELKSWIGALNAVAVLTEQPGLTLAELCHQQAMIYPERPALVGEYEELSYRSLSERMNFYAAWALAEGIEKGETISLLMGNCPEFAVIWLGLTQIGCTVALINSTLSANGVAHCMAAAESKYLIFGAVFSHVVEEALHENSATIKCWMQGTVAAKTFSNIDVKVAADSRKPSATDVALLIYTSGTTGMPKATKVTHGRLMEWSFWFAGMLNIQSDDRLYDCLPMYHSTGGVVAVGAMLARGAAVVIRERFSASSFWDDIIDERCTIFMYIGELCRYLTQSAYDTADRAHSLRLCCGNGLRGDVWQVFQERFRIPNIIEFYAATEGSVSLYNCTGMRGAIGHVPPFLRHRFPVALIKIDAETGEALRDQLGFCQPCGIDEIGEAIGKISELDPMPSRKFDGYTNADASTRKILRNVFAQGDAWFRTGDLLREDAQGYYYFVDRLGDSFRWKGENVSSEEVASVISSCVGINEAVVFGVSVPGFEGKAGMAVITTTGVFSFEVLTEILATRLPDYARPIFVRICNALEVTGTFKLKKHQLKDAGFLALRDGSTVWFFDRASARFVECDERLRQKIAQGIFARL
jgi:fatty-acyl-CoA synthase